MSTKSVKSTPSRKFFMRFSADLSWTEFNAEIRMNRWMVGQTDAREKSFEAAANFGASQFVPAPQTEADLTYDVVAMAEFAGIAGYFSFSLSLPADLFSSRKARSSLLASSKRVHCS
jgi:hypothetical protein